MNRLRALLRFGTASRRVLCCLTVSVGTTLLSAVVLVALVVGAGVPAGTANVIAVCCGIVPSYLGNRRWTWGRTGRGSVAREVVPFWVLSLAGLLLSTVTVALAGAATAAWPDSVRSIVLPLAQAGTFAALWVVQFVLLDRVIFRTTAAPECALPDIPVDQQRVAA
jgi:putative flippase GtrA